MSVALLVFSHLDPLVFHPDPVQVLLAFPFLFDVLHFFREATQYELLQTFCPVGHFLVADLVCLQVVPERL